MAASIRSLPLSPPLSSPYASTRHLATSPPSCRSCRRGLGFSGVRAAAEPVEVVGIGSRKEAVIDFCLGSRTLSSIPIRFWTILVMNNSKVQLTQRSHGADVVVRNLEPPLSLHPCPPAFILVASAGQDFDRIMAMELLNAVKSSGKLAASIFLKPFCFEGQRRQVEATDLISKLQVCSNFHIVIEADSLLETEVETLAEALESANNAVLSTISLISIMMSGFSQMFRSSLDAQIKEVDLEEVGKLLKSYGEARVGFGAGYNIQSAIKQAVFHCPFLRGGIKDLNNVVFLSLTSARIMDESDIISTLHIFRRVTGFTKDIIFCRNSEPDLEPKLVVITLLTVGCDKNVGSVTVKEGFLSSLALHFPFISSLTRGYSPEEEHTMSKHSFGQPADGGSSSSEQEPSSFFSAFTGSASVANLFSEKENIKSVSFRESNDGNERTHLESLEANFESDGIIGKDTDKEQLGLWQEHGFWSSMPSFGIAQMWAKERAATNGSNQSNELNNFTLPVGVKSSEIQYDHSLTTWADTSNATCSTSLAAGHAAFGASLTDVGLEKAMEICSSAMSFLKGRMDGSQKRGLLASRAAAMLDAERESEKMWSPIVEIKYGGGTYRGRCQEGVPEGKGRLTFRDGSFYDGLWRYGKRAGLGTFCYSNGDVFHGTWRDDLIHGKGWFYFHGGDRWFANFWKGKANGEGRFYSKDGSIFFGHFQNGWRHGESLWIDANGSRWVEVWDEGVLVSQTKLEK